MVSLDSNVLTNVLVVSTHLKDPALIAINNVQLAHLQPHVYHATMVISITEHVPQLAQKEHSQTKIQMCVRLVLWDVLHAQDQAITNVEFVNQTS